MESIRCAVDAAGDQRSLAEKVGVTPQAVNQWVLGRRPVPLAHCPAIEAATGGKVRCEQLRSDVIWQRDGQGRVTGYTVPIKPAA